MIIKCKFCNEDLLKKTYNQTYCNKVECRKKAKSIISKNDYEKHRERCKNNAKKLRYTRVCDNCWLDFKSYNKTKIVCSDKCYRERMSKNRIWEWNPAYRNWIYTKWWDKNSIRTYKESKFQRVCKEMNNEMVNKCWYRFCEFCWVNNSLRWEHHHIVFRSERPRHINLHDKENIIHLCIKCHNEFHKNKNIRNNILKERWLDNIFWIYVE